MDTSRRIAAHREVRAHLDSTVEGFGNHDPGSGRYNSQKPPWDVVHPGRPWADRLRENRRSKQEILTILSLRLSGATEGDGA